MISEKIKSPIIFNTKHRARFSELDPYGHMNTLHYVSYFIDHRFTECRQQLQLDFKAMSELPFIFVNSGVQLKFRKPIFSDEEFSITSKITEVTEKNCIVDCEMKKTNDEVASTCRMEITCLNKTTQRPTAWPAEFIEKFFK
jgi:YbgC/YbaW family acyl-CoA thioester hydrolase